MLTILLEKGGDPEAIAKDQDLMQVNDEGALREAVQAVLREHAGVVAEYKAGKESSLQFLVGMSMKAMKGAGNPGALKEILKEEIEKG